MHIYRENQILTKLILATRKVALLLDESLEGVGRKGMFFEGYGIDHLHSKLFPMHGTGNNSDFKNIESKINTLIHMKDTSLLMIVIKQMIKN